MNVWSDQDIILRTEVGDVFQHSHSGAISSRPHLTDLLPGLAGGVELKNVTLSWFKKTQILSCISGRFRQFLS